MSVPLLSITIGIDPNVFSWGNFTLTWHGLFTFVAVAVAVFLVGRWAKREGLVTDAVYSVAVWAIIGGIIGTRVFHVIDLWNDFYKDNPSQIFQIWEGGITIWGAILGGFVGGAAYIWIRNHPSFIKLWNDLSRRSGGASFTIRNLAAQPSKLEELRNGLGGLAPIKAFDYRRGMLKVTFEKPLGVSDLRPIFQNFGHTDVTIDGGRFERAPLPSVGRLADITAPAVLIAMALGRVGDIINGEHLAQITSLPWGFRYTDPQTALLYRNAGLEGASTHPAVVYEMLWDLIVLGVIWSLRGRLRPYGMLFTLYLALYSVGKFFVQFLRLDKEWAIGLTEAHFVAIVVLAITIPLLISRAKFVRRAVPGRTGSTAPAPGDRKAGST